MKANAKIARLAALATMLAAALQATAQAPHEGVWTSIDPNDGSRAYIGVNSAWQIVFFDSDATFGCREGGGGPFFGFDENNGKTVRLEGHVLVGYIEGVCQNGGKNQNTSFDFGMGHFPEYDTIRSRGTDWDRTRFGPESFVANALEMQKLSAGAWELFSYFTANDPPIVPGANCNAVEYDFDEIRRLTVMPNEPLDLRACDLGGVIIEGINARSILRQTHLLTAKFDYASFDMADFSGANLRDAIFLNSAIVSSYLLNADLSGAVFSATTLSNLDMRGVDLRGARTGDFSAQGQNLDLRRANLADADLRQFNLGGVIDVRHASLLRARFSLSNTASFIFHNTTCPDGTNSNDNAGICDLTWGTPY